MNPTYIIYGAKGCSKCDMAKRLLDIRGIEYQYKVAGVDYTADDLKADWGNPPPRELPFVIKGGYILGGLNELKRDIATQQ